VLLRGASDKALELFGAEQAPVHVTPKRWLSAANQERIPHDHRAIDCGAPNRDF